MPWDWNVFPQRALDQVFDLTRRVILNAMSDMESYRISCNRIVMGRGAHEFWRAKFGNRARYGSGTVAEIGQFYGALIIPDHFLDRPTVVGGGDFISDIRLLSDGQGSRTCSIAGKNLPQNLSVEIMIVGYDGARVRQRYGYQQLRNSLPPLIPDRDSLTLYEEQASPPPPAQPPDQQRLVQGTDWRVVGQIGDTIDWGEALRTSTPIPTPPVIVRKPPTELSPLRIAWLT